MDFLRELRDTALRLFGFMAVVAAITVGVVLLVGAYNQSKVGAPTPFSATTTSPKPALLETDEQAGPSPTGAIWVPSGAYMRDGSPVGYWTMPDGFRFRGTPELSQDQVFYWADRLRREGQASAVPQVADSNPRGPSTGLTPSAASNALLMALCAAFLALFPVGYLYRAILGTERPKKARRYAAWASVSSAPLFMVAIETLALGIRSGFQRTDSFPAALFSAEMLAQFESAIGRMIGLCFWTAIITGTAFVWGWFVENRTLASSAVKGGKGWVSGNSISRSSNLIWLVAGVLILLGYGALDRRTSSAGPACQVDWDGHMNPTVCE